MDWDKLRAFAAAAQAGSFTNAGALLNLSQSAISRQITSLEQDLKACLFHRHARGLKLTEQGELLHDTVREVIARVSMAEARLTELRDQPRGTLRVSVDAGFGSFWLAPRLRKFHELYPEIMLVLMLDGGGADLAMGEADIAIRMAAAEKADLIQRRIMVWRLAAYAAPDYVERHGLPAQPAELSRHRLVVLGPGRKAGEPHRDWLLHLGADGAAPRSPVAAFDSIDALHRAVSGGLGIGALPHFLSAEAAGLIPILPNLVSPAIDGYFLYPAELRHSKRIAVFRDFVLREIGLSRLNQDPCVAPALETGRMARGAPSARHFAGPALAVSAPLVQRIGRQA